MSREMYSPLPDESVVFRLAVLNKQFFPNENPPVRTEFFRPSTDDEKEGKENGRPPGVSVWDTSLTTTAQAHVIRGFDPKASNTLSFAIGVLHIREIGTAHEAEIDVVAVPLDESVGPGAEGHSHIEGLQTPSRARKKRFKSLRLDLVKACQRIR